MTQVTRSHWDRCDLKPRSVEEQHNEPNPFDRLGHRRHLRGIGRPDAALFIRSDDIERAWQLIDPIAQGWASPAAQPLLIYAPGSWGPAEAGAFIDRDSRVWRLSDGHND